MSVNINIRDASVQKLLGIEDPRVRPPDERKRDLVQLAGDVPDFTGTTDHKGVQSTLFLNRSAIAHPIVTYKDFVLTLDVYKHEGEPMVVHLICPRCHHCLTIPEQKKAIELELDAGPQNQGRISIETFECTWELEGEKRRMQFGLGLCRWRVAIENNVAKDA